MTPGNGFVQSELEKAQFDFETCSKIYLGLHSHILLVPRSMMSTQRVCSQNRDKWLTLTNLSMNTSWLISFFEMSLINGTEFSQILCCFKRAQLSLVYAVMKKSMLKVIIIGDEFQARKRSDRFLKLSGLQSFWPGWPAALHQQSLRKTLERTRIQCLETDIKEHEG